MQTFKFFLLDHRSYCINSIGDALAQLGHQVFFQSSWHDKEIEAGIAYFKPDILLTVGYNRRLFRYLERLPALCKKYRLFHIYWATEDLINHADWSLTFIRKGKPDLVWTIHPACVEKYERLGIPSAYLNFAFNPRLFPAKTKEDKEIYDLAFIGSTHLFKETYRIESLKQLLFPLVKEKQKVDIWGIGWKKEAAQIKKFFGLTVPSDRVHGFLPYKKTAFVYRSAKIVLGVQNAVDQVTQRTFEILGSGAFMIASRTKALEELFTDRQEIVLTKSAEETLDLINFYLKRPELRLQIGQNARRKIMQHHTYKQRLQKVWPQAQSLILQHKS
ncbi:MAG: glycosyltransferase [Firmicutes bacterium]|nr:glycosyltransferase [Bacillota bacterium]